MNNWQPSISLVLIHPLPALIMVKHSQTSTEEYEVEAILSKREYHNQPQYLVKWSGFSEAESTWEPLSHLEGSADIVRDYEEKHGRKLAVAKKRVTVQSQENGQKPERAVNREEDYARSEPVKTPKIATKSLVKSPLRSEVKPCSAVSKSLPKPEAAKKSCLPPQSHPVKKTCQFNIENWHIASEPKHLSPGSFPQNSVNRVLRSFREQGELRFEVQWQGEAANTVVTLEDFAKNEPMPLIEYLAGFV